MRGLTRICAAQAMGWPLNLGGIDTERVIASAPRLTVMVAGAFACPGWRVQSRRVGSGRVSTEMTARAAASVAPLTLPLQAYGPNPVEWFDPPRPVWAWVHWPNRSAERVQARATGANDRVVVLEVPCEGGHWSPVVWRNAVTVRSVS